MLAGQLARWARAHPVLALHWKRLRPGAWALLSLYFTACFSMVSLGASNPALIQAVPVFWMGVAFFLSARAWDDLACTRFEVSRGLRRFYHRAPFRASYTGLAILFGVVFVYLLIRTGRSIPLFSGYLLVTLLSYWSLGRTAAVQWISLLKYPFLALLLTEPGSAFRWQSAFVTGAAFVYREAQEESQGGGFFLERWAGWIPLFMSFALLSKGIAFHPVDALALLVAAMLIRFWKNAGFPVLLVYVLWLRLRQGGIIGAGF